MSFGIHVGFALKGQLDEFDQTIFVYGRVYQKTQRKQTLSLCMVITTFQWVDPLE